LELEEEGEGEGDREREGDVDRAHDDVDERARDEISDTQDVDGLWSFQHAAPNMRYPASSIKPKIRHDTQYYENIH
jgi:hypothetical protein